MSRPIDLARQLAALPGAPTFEGNHLAYRRSDITGGDLGYRTRNGLGWIQDRDDFARYVVDLEDAATGGVMLTRLGVDHGVITTADGWSVCNHRDPRAQVYTGPTLALALARVLIARGGWDG
jgi:hypothetical protein